MAGLLNRDGGHILLGVEDDQSISGLTRSRAKAEEWVMETARSHLQPAAIPAWETILWDDDKMVGVVSLPADAPDKPYKAKRGSGWVTKIRVGTTTRDATREEEARLYQQSGQLQYELKPVPRAPGTAVDTLDWRRLHEYFTRVLAGDAPNDEDAGARHARNQLLVNVMRDYGYVDARGMGVRNKLIPGMKAHNGTEPDLIEEEYRFTVRLWKEATNGRESC